MSYKSAVLLVPDGGSGRNTLTNHGVLVGAGTSAVTQLAAGSTGQVLQSGGASGDPAYSTPTYPSASGSSGTILRSDGTNNVYTTATYPATTSVSQLLFSSSANVIGGLTTANGGVLVTSNTGVPSILAGSGTSGQVLQAVSGGAPAWSTPTFPSTSGSAGVILRSDGTNYVATTATYPATTTINQVLYSSSANVIAGITTANNGVHVTNNTGVPSVLAGGTAGQVLQSVTGASPAWSTPTYPSASGSTGVILRSDGTNYVATTSTYPNTNAASTLLYASSANVMAALATANNGTLVTSNSGVPSILAGGTAGQVLQSVSSAAPAWSTPTYPSASGSAGQILRSDGTNNVYTTTTYPNTNAINTLLYASSANVMSALATANTAVLATNGSGVPSLTATPTVTSITFGSGTALSTYAEGTFTPTVVGNSTAGTTTYTSQTGNYVKIGKLVYFSLLVNWSNATGTGSILFGGLPFTVQNTGVNVVPAATIYTNIAITTATSYVIYLNANGTTGIVNGMIASTGTEVASSLASNTAKYLYMSGSYYASS